MGKVLLVDDDDATRLAASRALRAAGHAVVTANDGQECLDLYRASPADVVIMDLYMPHKDGLETLLELRREFPHASVIAVSGHRDMNLMLKAAKGLGAVRALTKPFDPETLVAIVAEEMEWVAGLAKAHKPQVRAMDLEICPKCRSWRVTETKSTEHTNCVCQACDHTWSVSARGGAEPEKPPGGSQPPAADGTGPHQFL